MSAPLVDAEYLLQKFPGKGGWTYALIPEIPQDKNAPFGWVQVKGSIDGFPLNRYKLMPMGNGQLFLPVRAEIRKKIGKGAGDFVRVILYADHSRMEIPEEIMACFDQEPREVKAFFLSLRESEQKAYIDWIYAAKKEETKALRILRMLERLSRGQRLGDSEDDVENL